MSNERIHRVSAHSSYPHLFLGGGWRVRSSNTRGANRNEGDTEPRKQGSGGRAEMLRFLHAICEGGWLPQDPVIGSRGGGAGGSAPERLWGLTQGLLPKLPPHPNVGAITRPDPLLRRGGRGVCEVPCTHLWLVKG